ncbi:MAG: hypothetical protein WKI04_00090 [Ferruginibacter sp.]
MIKSIFLLRYKIHHLVFWLVVFGAWYFLRYEDYSRPGLAFQVTLIKVIDLALMVYITNGLLIHGYSIKKDSPYLRWLLFCWLFRAALKMNLLELMNSPQLYNLAGNHKEYMTMLYLISF